MRTAVEWGVADGSSSDLVLVLREEHPSGLPANPIYGPLVEIDEFPELNEVDEWIQDALFTAYGFVVGYSASMHAVCRWVRALAHPAAEAFHMRGLVIGETGVGKELVARSIHNLSRRREEPFVAVNCGAIPSTLALAEMFGHVKGAFTGAIGARVGYAEQAGAGTLFLDEIGDLPRELQPLLLRMIEQREFNPLGSSETKTLRAQVVAATHHSLADAVEAGTFRADLYFRLAQVTITVPSLTERREDVPLLAAWTVRSRAPEVVIPHDLLVALSALDWPGNVRQLRNTLERLLLMRAVSADWTAVRNEVLSRNRAGQAKSPGERQPATFAMLRADFERDVLERVLARCDGDTELVARELDVTRRTVYNLLKRYDLGGNRQGTDRKA